jgi:hypothetical protein
MPLQWEEIKIFSPRRVGKHNHFTLYNCFEKSRCNILMRPIWLQSCISLKKTCLTPLWLTWHSKWNLQVVKSMCYFQYQYLDWLLQLELSTLYRFLTRSTQLWSISVAIIHQSLYIEHKHLFRCNNMLMKSHQFCSVLHSHLINFSLHCFALYS